MDLKYGIQCTHSVLSNRSPLLTCIIPRYHAKQPASFISPPQVPCLTPSPRTLSSRLATFPNAAAVDIVFILRSLHFSSCPLCEGAPAAGAAPAASDDAPDECLEADMLLFLPLVTPLPPGECSLPTPILILPSLPSPSCSVLAAGFLLALCASSAPVSPVSRFPSSILKLGTAVDNGLKDATFVVQPSCCSRRDCASNISWLIGVASGFWSSAGFAADMLLVCASMGGSFKAPDSPVVPTCVPFLVHFCLGNAALISRLISSKDLTAMTAPSDGSFGKCGVISAKGSIDNGVQTRPFVQIGSKQPRSNGGSVTILT